MVSFPAALIPSQIVAKIDAAQQAVKLAAQQRATKAAEAKGITSYFQKFSRERVVEVPELALFMFPS
jgi:hypothetical protein